jgi:hypothetical protein
MFRFSMNIDKMRYSSMSEPRKINMKEDPLFQRKLWMDFYRQHPEYSPERPDSEGYNEAIRLLHEIVYKIENINPPSFFEAKKLVKELFVFSPSRIWLENQEFNLSEF